MTSKLTQKTPYESEHQFAKSLQESFENLEESQLKPPFPLTIPTHPQYIQLNQAILYAILTRPDSSKLHIKHLHAVITDGYAYFTSLLTTLVNELYTKLFDNVRVQVIWVLSELIDVSADGVDALLVSLFRQTRGGYDFSDGNLWLCLELVGVLLRKWGCLVEEFPGVVSNGLYVFLRLLGDHCCDKVLSFCSKVEVLKGREIEFCVRVFREEFGLCFSIGRDLVRVLQDLVHVDEFRDIWKDLLLQPEKFGMPGFTDISQLYWLRTSSRYFLLRISPEMEAQLRFLLTNVKIGSQTRYQTWFGKKFLNVLENESVVIDIVRFICCAHHPSNKVILSNVMPRWAVIGWLLKCCTKNYIEANVKLALFYDWLFFREEVDNIMNIEPAILLTINSIPRYVDMTNNLLEFLLLLVDHYDIERKDLIVRGVSSALDMLERKGVVQSYDALTSCGMISSLLKERLVKLLPSKNVSV
uniref:integrator complex subunit 3 n=1 Tax=Erigeron canadensis TaxID=72917 RepID=UPI001CB8E312|nr:integrator complex subunit 3 [Erigeron canadensis]